MGLERALGRLWSALARFSGILGIRLFYGQDALEQILAHDVGEVLEVDLASEDLWFLPEKRSDLVG